MEEKIEMVVKAKPFKGYLAINLKHFPFLALRRNPWFRIFNEEEYSLIPFRGTYTPSRKKMELLEDKEWEYMGIIRTIFGKNQVNTVVIYRKREVGN